MLDPASGVEAYVRKYGKSAPKYQEYEVPPGSRVWTGNANECCIEAVVNERYCLVVELSSYFDFKGASTVKICCNVNDDAVHFGRLIQRTPVPRPRAYIVKLDNCRRSVDGERKWHPLTFGEAKAGM